MIYLDLVFILNFVYDFLLLLTTGVVLKRIFSLKKVLLGALIGAISIFLLFLSFSTFLLFLLKIIISIIMIIVVFGKENIIINCLYLYMNSVILAGFLYYLSVELSYSNIGLAFYFDDFSINYVLILIIAPVILFIYYKQVKLLKEKQNLNYKVNVVLNNGEEYLLNGFIDSGNKLKDPITRKHVIIVSDKNLLFKEENPIYVPFHGVNKKGLLKCFKVKFIEINNQKFTNYLLGISDSEINLEGVSVILNYKLLEDLNV